MRLLNAEEIRARIASAVADAITAGNGVTGGAAGRGAGGGAERLVPAMPNSWVIVGVYDGPMLRKNFFYMTSSPTQPPHETLGLIEVAQGVCREDLVHWLRGVRVA